MACISYDTPELNVGNGASINNFINIMDQNMILAGLIRETTYIEQKYNDSWGAQNIVDFDTNTFEAYFSTYIRKSTSNYASSQYLVSIIYSLPIGDKSIEYIDHETIPDCKKISRASYDNTALKIQIDFIYYYCNANNGNYIGNYTILPFINIYNKFDQKFGSFGNGYNIWGPGTDHNIMYNFSGKSYISLTNDTVSLSIGSHTLTGMYGAYNNNDFYRYFINVNIYRNNQDIFVYGITPTLFNTASNIKYLNHANSDIKMISYEANTDSSTTINNFGNNFLSWPHTDKIPSIIDGNIVYTNVWAITTNNIQIVPQFVVTKLNNITVNELEFIYKYNGYYVSSNFINLGLTEKAQNPITRQSTTYSWAFLHDENIIYTTDHITGPE